MKLGLIQLNIVTNAKHTNIARAETFIRQASGEGCDLAILPELFDTGFSEQIVTSAAAEPVTSDVLAALARTYHINLVAGYAEGLPGRAKIANAAAGYDRGGQLLVHYTKIHPFSLAGEDRYFVPGERLATCAIDGVASGVLICYDLRFPEVFRMLASKVAIMMIVANWPTSRKDHWCTLLKARAIENQCFVIGVNRTGTDHNGLHFPGASQIFDPFGQQICAGDETQELVMAEIEVAEVARIRKKFPFLQDRRPLTVQLESQEQRLYGHYGDDGSNSTD
jgi:omega-amidase